MAVTDDEALIYVYTPERGARTTIPIPPSISLNDEEIGTLEFNSYYALKITPGDHVLTAQKVRGNLATIQVTLQPGDVKYIKYVEEATGNVKHINGATQQSVRSALVEQSSELADREIINTKLLSQL